MSFNIGIGFALDGEKEFKAGIREINSELRLLDSQSKLVEAQYASNANSLQALTAKHELLVKQLEEEQKKVKLNSDQLETWQEISRRAEERVNDLKQQLADAETEMDRMKESSGATSDELEKQQKTINDLNAQLKNAERAYGESENKVTRYQTSLTKVETDLVNLDSRLKENEKYLEEAQNSSDNLAKSIDEYGNKVEDATSKTSVFGDVLKASLVSEAIIQGAKKIGEGIGEISKATVNTGAEFEHSMSQVAATMGMTVEEIASGSKAYETLKTAAEESGKSTKYTAAQAAEALNYLALAGYDAEKAAATLPAVLNLAAAGGLDLAYASDLVTDSMAALGIETSGLNNYIDEMARTAQKSNTSVAQLGEATLVTAGMAYMTEQSLETLNAELGVLANNGIKGAEGGTHLRNILQSLVVPTDKGVTALSNLNVQVKNSDGSIRDLNDILTDLNTGLSGLSTSDKTNIISTIFNRTDIAAVNALLKGTGDEFDNLYKELKDCSGAASDMAATMEANLTGKVTILESALEGLAITAYDKIKGTLSNSVDSATDAVGRLQDSMDNGKLGDSMDSFAESLNDAANEAIDFAEDALPAVIEGLTWVLDNGDAVAAGITGIVAANVEMKVVVPAVKAVVEVWEAYKKKTEGAAVSQWLLNTAMNANPAGILITAIVGITAALTTYAALNRDVNTELEDMIDEHQRMTDQINSEKEKINENITAHKNQITVTGQLKEKIAELNSKEKLSNDEKAEMSMLVAELNQILPDLNLLIDEQTGKLADNTEGWQDAAEAQMRAIEAQLREEDAVSILEKKHEIDKEIVQLTEERAENEEKLAEATERLNECLEDGVVKNITLYSTADQYEQEMYSLNEAIKEQERHQKELQASSDELEEEYYKLMGVTEGTAGAMNGAKEAIEEVDKATVTYRDNTYEVSSSVAASIESIETAYMNAKTEAYDSITEQIGLFQELDTASDASAAQMAENLQSQTEAFTNYSDNLILAMELMKNDTTGNLTEIVTAIEAMGIDGAGYLEELINAWEEGNESFNEVLTNWAEMSEAKETLAETMADFETNYTESMDALLEVQTERTTSMQDDWETKTNDILTDVKQKNADTVTETSNTMTTLDTTIKTEGEKVKTSAKQVVKDTISGVETELGIADGKSQKFYQIGYAVSDGMAEGILAGMPVVVAAAAAVAQAAFNASKATLEVNSPSKKYEWLGYESSEGLVVGYVSNMESAKGRIAAATDTLLDYEHDAGNITDFSAKSSVAGTNIGEMTIIFQPQTMSEEEIDNAFNYINERFGSAI